MTRKLYDPTSLCLDLTNFLIECRRCSWFDQELHDKLVKIFSMHDPVVRKGPIAAALAETLRARMYDLAEYKPPEATRP